MNEPKYQWSKFGGPDRNEQYVVREDDFDVFKEARSKIMTEFFSSPINTSNIASTTGERGWFKEPKPTAEEMGGAAVVPDVGVKCATCGAPAVEKTGISKSGKPWHARFCSTEDKSHVQWV
jgi:hypothetical protein